MNYLFYDVECMSCKGGLGKICSFGYVLCDEALNIIEKDDILINPSIERKDYDWYVVKNILTYKITEIEQAPDFKKRYDEIKDILTNPENITLGFDVKNDMLYINDECKRFELPELDIKSYDLQKIYREYSGDKRRKGLQALLNDFAIKIDEFKKHNSRDDSMMTMFVAKEICHKMNLSLQELINMCNNCIIKECKRVPMTGHEENKRLFSKKNEAFSRTISRKVFMEEDLLVRNN